LQFDEDGNMIRSGKMSALPISACVTLTGRKAILLVKDYVEHTIPGAKIIYIDTDSVFIHIPGITLEETFKIGKRLSVEITKIFTSSNPNSTMRIEHEKTAGNAVFWKSKNYALEKYEKLGVAPKVETKGAAFIKGDSCALNKTFGEELVTKVLKESKEEFVAYIKKRLTTWISDWKDGRYNPDDFILRKGLSKDTKDYGSRTGHTALADRINERTGGMGPGPGETVEYMHYINEKAGQKSKKMEDTIEEPSYILEKHLRVDFLKYIKGQIYQTLKLVTSPIMSLDEQKSLVEPYFSKLSQQQITAHSFEDISNDEFEQNQFDGIPPGYLV